MSPGPLVIPQGLPQATVWIIRVHVRGLTCLSGLQIVRQLTNGDPALMSGQVSPHTIYLNVNQLGQCEGLTLYLQVIIICIFIFIYFFQLIDWLWSAVLLLGVTVTAS